MDFELPDCEVEDKFPSLPLPTFLSEEVPEEERCWFAGKKLTGVAVGIKI